MSKHESLIICGTPDPDLYTVLSRKAYARMESGSYSPKSVEDVQMIDTMPIKGNVDLSPELVEAFRRMCQVHNVTLLESEITSHRPLIGPVIVFGKKLIYRILRPLLEKTLHQQREFNAAAIYALGAVVSNRKG